MPKFHVRYIYLHLIAVEDKCKTHKSYIECLGYVYIYMYVEFLRMPPLTVPPWQVKMKDKTYFFRDAPQTKNVEHPGGDWNLKLLTKS